MFCVYWDLHQQKSMRERERESAHPEGELPNSESFPRLEKMIRAISASHRTESS